MKRVIFYAFTLVLLLAHTGMAQVEDDRERQEREDRERKVLERAQETYTPGFTSFVASLLPDSNGAWTVSISRSGGFGGGSSQLVGAVNSDGIYTCGSKNDTYKTNVLDLSLVTDLESFVAGSNLKLLRKQFKPTASFCSDCYLNLLEITVREKKKVKSHLFVWSLFPDSNVEIRNFYDKVLLSTNCQSD